MRNYFLQMKWIRFGFILGLAMVAVNPRHASAAGSEVPKWGRFEQSFQSSAAYDNPLQQARLTVVFTVGLVGLSR